MRFGTSDDDLIRATIEARVARGARVVAIRSRVLAPRQPPRCDVIAHDVEYESPDGRKGSISLVTKDAPLVERRTLTWLAERRLSVPFSYSLDPDADGLAPLCLRHVPDEPPDSVPDVARRLAEVHLAGMGRAAELSWLPSADRAYVEDFIVDRCWRRPWRSTLENSDYVDAYGRSTPAGTPGDFPGRFDRYTAALEDAATRFVRAAASLWDEGDSLTLIHADFHDEHVRFADGRAYLLDWDQARHGPLYFDLPNYFSREDALVYRDALAALGHDVPRDEFLARYDAVRAYPGFKYFGVGLWGWRYGDPPHQDALVQHFVDMVL